MRTVRAAAVAAPSAASRTAARTAAWAALWAALLVTGCGGADAAPSAPPDVLFVSLDTVRADDLTFLDADVAPHLSELARRGTIFTQAISGSSWTLPSHAQMFTGLPPIMHGVCTDSVCIDPAVSTLPERLEAAGYWCAGLYTNWYVAGPYGFARGFDAYVNAMSGGEEVQRRMIEALARDDVDGVLEAMGHRDVKLHEDVSSERLVDRAMELLAGAPPGPRFLFAHFMDPHMDWIPPPPFDTRFDPDYTGPFDGQGLADDLGIWDARYSPPRRIGDRDLEHLRALYRGEIAWVDRQVGRLLDALERDGRLERTLVVVTADHGEEFFEHGNFGHRASLYDEVLRVPLLIVPPGGRAEGAPARVDLQVGLSDLMPTVLDYAGAAVPGTVIGRSLRPLMEGRTLPPRPLVTSLLHVGPARAEGRTDRAIEALRTERSKLVRMLELPPDGPPRVTGLFYYDLERDPGEQRPLTDPTHPDVRAAWDAMEAHVAGLRAAWRALPSSPLAERGIGVARLFEDELSALGYAGSVVHPWQPRLLGPLPPLPPPGRRPGR
jgi:arylsulfatase A-like enzyme